MSTFQTSQKDLEVISQVVQSGITGFHVYGIQYIPAGDLRGILKTLQAGTHLVSLTLQQHEEGDTGMGFDVDSFTMLVELLRSNSMHALKELKLPMWTIWPGFYATLQQNSAIESLEVDIIKGFREAGREIVEYIQTTKTLKALSSTSRAAREERVLVSGEAGGEIVEFIQTTKTLKTLSSTAREGRVHWRSFFKSLRDNTSIRSLEIDGNSLCDDDVYREFMAMLQVNSTLQKVEFKDGPDERKATIQEALRCKARQESYLAELKRGFGGLQVEWQRPRCGRIFLCGSPNAGKTRLTRTMLKFAKGKSLMKRFKERVLRRTEGIEIHSLRNDDEMQILVWDLAGQDIFRALQQFLFPRLSRSSVFIFVFSPVHKDEREWKLKAELENTFEKELLEWLKFIASNSAVTGFSLPEVLVVISHKDKCNADMDSEWYETILKSLTKDFINVIHIHSHPHFIDSHESEQVKLVVKEVYETFNLLFGERLFRLPLACSRMSQELVNWVSENKNEPVIRMGKFFSLCENVPDLKSFSQQKHEEEKRKVLEAVGMYLHDVGTVINMTAGNVVEKFGKPMMVVNTNWLTHLFLGRVIYCRNDFQLPLGEELNRLKFMKGSVSKIDFFHFLSKHILEPMKEFTELTPEILQDLMECLDLLYVIEPVGGHTHPRFFVPTLLKPKTEQTLRWDPDTRTSGKISFLGVRLRCRDPRRTYLSQAFFSRFQVTMWRKLMEQLQQKAPRIDCKFNLISILVDGLDIRIENDRDGDFIDILIRSKKSREMMWDFVETHFVEELRAFCASPKGCPGVELVMDIIRTQCVELLTSCEYRKTQSVSKEDLKRQLMDSVRKLGPGSREGDWYSHTWAEVPQAGIRAGSEDALDLLPPPDLKELRAWITHQTEYLGKRVVKIKRVIMDIDNPGGGPSEVMYETGMSQQSISPKEYRIRRDVQQVVELVKEVREDVRGLLELVQEVKSGIEKIICLQLEKSEHVTQMHQKLDQLIGNSESTTQWPKRPYFTQKDVSYSHWITAAVDIGKPLVLHFECEAEGRSHIVPEQRGYPITVGKENCEFLRQMSKTSVQVIWYLLKAGVHISTSLGDLVPELQTSDGSTLLLDKSSMANLLNKVQVQDAPSSKQPLSTCSPEEAWRYLQNVLESHLQVTQITDYFLLHPARFSDSPSTQAWLCQEMSGKRIGNGSIKGL